MTTMSLAGAKKILEKVVRPSMLFRVSEAAIMTGLCAETIRRRIRRGEIRAWGRPCKVALDDLLPVHVPRRRKK